MNTQVLINTPVFKIIRSMLEKVLPAKTVISNREDWQVEKVDHKTRYHRNLQKPPATAKGI